MPAATERPIELSPFVVNTDRDLGYQAVRDPGSGRSMFGWTSRSQKTERRTA